MGYYSDYRDNGLGSIDLRELSKMLDGLASRIETKFKIERDLDTIDRDIVSGNLRPNERDNAISYFNRLSRNLEHLKRELSDIEDEILRYVGDKSLAADLIKYYIDYGGLPRKFVEDVEDSKRYGVRYNNDRNGRVVASRNAFSNFNPRNNSDRTNEVYINNQNFANLLTNSNQTYRERNRRESDDSDYIPIYTQEDVAEIVSENLKKNERELPKDSLFDGGDDLHEFKVNNVETKKTEVVVRENAEEENLIILKKGKEMNKNIEKRINLLPYRVLIQNEGMNPKALEKMTLDTVYDRVVSVDKAKFNFRYESDVSEYTTLDKEAFEKYGMIDPSNIEVINFISKDQFSKISLSNMNKSISTIHINRGDNDERLNPSVLNSGELAYISTVLSRSLNTNSYYDSEGNKINLNFPNHTADEGKGLLGLHIPTKLNSIAIEPVDYDILPNGVEESSKEMNEKLETFLSKLAESISKVMKKLSTSKDLYSMFVEFNRILVERRLTVNDLLIPKEILFAIQSRVLMALNDVVSKSCLTDVDFFENFDETRIDYIMEKVSMICLYLKHRVNEKDIENYIRSSIIKPLYQIVSSLSIEKMINTVTMEGKEYKSYRFKLSYNLTEQNVLLITSKEILPELHSWYVSNENNVIVTKDSFPFIYNIINSAQKKMRELEIKDDDITNASMVGYRLYVSLSSYESGENIAFVAHPTICDCGKDVLYVLSAVK